jgi:nuclear GTP-binding protein
VTNVSPVPGETKVWRYITLFKRIFLIDCPGVVYESNDSEADKVFKGVVRAEKIEAPEEYIDELLKRIRYARCARVRAKAS